MMAELTFDPRRPFGRVFKGEGKPKKSEADCVYFQDGLYFDTAGRLVRNEHNDSILRARTKAEEPPPPEKHSSDIVDKLMGEPDDVVFRMAVNVTRKLAKEGKQIDYEPELANRDENIRFIDENT